MDLVDMNILESLEDNLLYTKKSKTWLWNFIGLGIILLMLFFLFISREPEPENTTEIIQERTMKKLENGIPYSTFIF